MIKSAFAAVADLLRQVRSARVRRYLALTFFVDAGLVFVLLVAIQSYLPEQYDASEALAGYVLAAYGASKLAGQLGAGWLIDRIGPRRGLLAGLCSDRRRPGRDGPGRRRAERRDPGGAPLRSGRGRGLAVALRDGRRRVRGGRARAADSRHDHGHRAGAGDGALPWPGAAGELPLRRRHRHLRDFHLRGDPGRTELPGRRGANCRGHPRRAASADAIDPGHRLAAADRLLADHPAPGGHHRGAAGDLPQLRPRDPGCLAARGDAAPASGRSGRRRRGGPRRPPGGPRRADPGAGRGLPGRHVRDLGPFGHHRSHSRRPAGRVLRRRAWAGATLHKRALAWTFRGAAVRARCWAGS